MTTLWSVSVAFSGETNDEGEEEARERSTDFKESLAIVIMTTIIVAFSIFMEQYVMDPLKEAPKENVNLGPIVNTMFSELTLLGFVGLFMFVVEKLDLLSNPSYRVFHNKETMSVLFEDVHMVLFLVMILFLFNAFCLLTMGGRIASRWKRANVRAMDEREELVEEYASYIRNGSTVPEDVEFAMAFLGLRDRFVRNGRPNLEDVEEEKLSPRKMAKAKKKRIMKAHEVPHDFELNEYFSMIMGKKAGEIIEVPISTWAILEVVLLCMWFIKLPCTPFQFSIIFIFVGYLIMLLSFMVDRHLRSILDELIPSKYYEEARSRALRDEQNVDEMTALNVEERKEEDEKRKEVPPFLLRPLEEIKRSHTGLKKVVFGRTPNKHEHLFVGGAMGHHLLMQMVRMIALGTAIYLAIFLVVMLNPILERFGHHIVILTLILFIAATPVVVNFYGLCVLVSDFVVVSSVEMMKDPEVIHMVKRHMVTKKAMTALRMLNAMRRSLPSLSDSKTESLKAKDVWTDPHVLHEKERHHREMFELFDTDRSGFIDEEEFNHLLSMMRCGKDDEERKRIFSTLDKGGNGDVSFEEFFDWIASRSKEDEEELSESHIEEIAEKVFDMIDAPDESGERDGVITPLEFHQCIQNLSHSDKTGEIELDLEDVEAMFREADEDGDGDLDNEEFEALLKKYLFD